MGADVDALSGLERGGSHMIDEDERSDHAATGEWEDASHGEAAAEVSRAGFDDEVEHAGLLSWSGKE